MESSAKYLKRNLPQYIFYEIKGKKSYISVFKPNQGIGQVSAYDINDTCKEAHKG